MNNFVVNVWKGASHLMSASSSDAELVAELKVWAESKGYRVTIADYSKMETKGS